MVRENELQMETEVGAKHLELVGATLGVLGESQKPGVVAETLKTKDGLRKV
jgi:hypothetical protein